MNEPKTIGGMTLEEHGRMMRNHRMIKSPGFQRGIDAANRKADQLERERRRVDRRMQPLIDGLLNWNPPMQKALDAERAKVRKRMQPYLDALLRR